MRTQVGTRNPKQCRERLFDNLDPTINHSPLTEEEEQLLVQLVQAHGTKWAVISAAMPQANGRRPGNQLKNNWNRLMGPFPAQSLPLTRFVLESCTASTADERFS